jgi:hypothetical protein
MKLKLAILMSLSFLAISCSYSSESAATSNAAPSTSSGPSDFAIASSSNTGGGGGGRAEPQERATEVSLSKAELSQNVAVPDIRKIIRNAEFNLESDSPEETQKKITGIAESMGGFVVESQQSSSDVRSTTRDVVIMKIRVPAEKFNETLEEIRKTANRVVSENAKGQDVTEEFIDIEAQLKAKQALEQQFMEIMKRANSVEDALNVNRELASVRAEIEKIEGRKRFLENQASLSTVNIRIQTPAALSASSAGFGYRLTESFGRGIDFALDFVLGLITFLIGALPFALFIGLPGFFIGRYIWRRQNREKTARAIANAEITGE